MSSFKNNKISSPKVASGLRALLMLASALLSGPLHANHDAFAVPDNVIGGHIAVQNARGDGAGA